MIPINRYRSAREESFNTVWELLVKRKNMTFVELGMIRNEDAIVGDGLSTLLWAELALKTDSHLYSVDISPKSLEITEKLLKRDNLFNPELIHLIQEDATIFLKTFACPVIDFLYMDAWGYEPYERESTEKAALESFQAAESKFIKDSLILVDDVLDFQTYEGKGKLVIPYAQDNGYFYQHFKYQVLLCKL